MDQARHAHAPILTGGKHERTPRARHRERAGIAGLGRARAGAEEAGRRAARRPRCAIGSSAEILARVPGTEVNGAREPRVPNTTNISFDRVEAESLLIALDLEGHRRVDRLGVLVGHARAVARAAGDGPADAPRAELDPLQPRRRNTDAEIDYLLEKLPRVVEKLRARSPRSADGGESDSG